MDIKNIHNIYVLCGGVSVEHEISLLSAKNIINVLYEDYDIYPVFINKDGSWACHAKVEDEIQDPKDLVLETIDEPALSIGRFLYEDYRAGENNFFIPCLHGSYGEDGIIQGILEAFDVPYLGSGVLSSAVCMDKVLTNEILDYKGIDQADFVCVNIRDYESKPEETIDKIEEIGYPVFVKPANAGSSVGVSKAKDKNSLVDAIKNAFKYDDKLVVEDEVVGRELEIAVLGNEVALASLPGEHVVEGHEFFNYDSKYKDHRTVLKSPAELDDKTQERARELALRVYKILGCRGLARVDIFLKDDGDLLVNEINTFPGMTEHSLYPLLWGPTCGYNLKDLVGKLIAYGLDAYEDKKRKKRAL